MSQPADQPRRTPPSGGSAPPAATARPATTAPRPAAATTSGPTAASTPTQPPAGAPIATRVSRSSGPAAPAPKPRAKKAQRRHARVVIRKVGPWSVFKLSVVFYFCVMLVLLGAGIILYGMLGAIGALDSTTRLIRDLFADQDFVINGRWLFSRGLTVGLVMVFVWSLINVFIAFLYNLISDLVGGVEVTLAERR